MEQQKTLAQLIKEKYPIYAQIPDDVLERTVLEKYPQYQVYVDSLKATPAPPMERPPTPGSIDFGGGFNVPRSFVEDFAEGVFAPENRPTIGGAMGAAIGTAATRTNPLGAVISRLFPLGGAMFGGAAGAASAGGDVEEMLRSGLAQGKLQLGLGELPVAAAAGLLPMLQKPAVFMNTQALRAHVPEDVLRGTIRPQGNAPAGSGLGVPLETPMDALKLMARRELQEGFGTVGTDRAAKAAVAKNRATVGVKDAAVLEAEAAGKTVDPRKALSGMRGVQDEAGASMTQSTANLAGIRAEIESYLKRISDPVTRLRPEVLSLPRSGGEPPLRIPTGGTETYTYMRPRSEMAPTEAVDMLRRSGSELQPKWLAETPQAAIDARKSLYSNLSDEVERLDPVIEGANSFLHQNIPLQQALESASLSGAGAHESLGLSSRMRPYLNTAISLPTGKAAQGLWNLSFMAPGVQQSQNIPNALRALSFMLAGGEQ